MSAAGSCVVHPCRVGSSTHFLPAILLVILGGYAADDDYDDAQAVTRHTIQDFGGHLILILSPARTGREMTKDCGRKEVNVHV